MRLEMKGTIAAGTLIFSPTVLDKLVFYAYCIGNDV